MDEGHCVFSQTADQINELHLKNTNVERRSSNMLKRHGHRMNPHLLNTRSTSALDAGIDKHF